MTYNYGFRLPVDRIAATQEDHASQCEALGPTMCRVSGMTYHVSRNRSVQASLVLRLAPDAARHFGRQAIDAVGKHGGMLVDAQIDSEEAGATVAGANADNASRSGERARIEQQLAKPGLGSTERTSLQSRLSDLQDAERNAAATARDAAVKLTSAPMTLQYASGDVDLSLTDGPVLGAVKDGWANIVSGFALILMMAISLVPWLVAVALAVFGWIKAPHWIARRSAPTDDPPAPPA